MEREAPRFMELSKEQKFEVSLPFHCDDSSIMLQSLVRIASSVGPFSSLAHEARLSRPFQRRASEGGLPFLISSEQLALLETCCRSSASALGYACRGCYYESCLRWKEEWGKLEMSDIAGMPDVMQLCKAENELSLHMLDIKAGNTPNQSIHLVLTVVA